MVRPPKDPALGVTLTRTWNGREVSTIKVEGGWEHEGQLHRSLSAVANAITGAHWNGKLFFGLKTRKAKP